MTIEELIAALDAEAIEIQEYKSHCQYILGGANNLLKFNPGPPSNVPLTQEVQLYTEAIARADESLSQMQVMKNALVRLQQVGYPALPVVPASADAGVDLAHDQQQNDAAIAQMRFPSSGAGDVSGTVGPERPTP